MLCIQKRFTIKNVLNYAGVTCYDIVIASVCVVPETTDPAEFYLLNVENCENKSCHIIYTSNHTLS